ncbi:MAG: F0F1 ATP synthase subunit A [Pelolinea sp.]|nr:F0F1 ATP synthase subunit A [Pelolinea sp.]
MESITPQIIFYVFGIPINSTIISTWIGMLLIIILAAITSRYFPHALDMLGEFLSSMVSGIMTADNVDEYLPLLGSLAIFVAVANSIGIIPILSAPTSDINTPIALALVVFFGVYFYGIRKKGIINYFKELASPIFLLPFEIIGQVSRTVSLSLRLFGNILSGEMISAIVFGLLPLIAPLPFIGLGLFLGILQAYVFTALASLYIDLAIATEN